MLLPKRGLLAPDAGLHFLVVSLGNPLPEYASLHSAGHFVLDGLARVLGCPPMQRGQLNSKSSLVSRGARHTLVRSPSYMNESGESVASIWRQTLVEHGPRRHGMRLALAVVHDELDMALGAARPVPWDRSARGHNGVRSVQRHLDPAAFPSYAFTRIAVGIDRPVSRDSDVVAQYVLAPISVAKRRVLETDVPWIVKRCLEAFEEDWVRKRGSRQIKKKRKEEQEQDVESKG